MKKLLMLTMLFAFSLSYGQNGDTTTINLKGVEVTGVRSNDKMPVTQTTITKSDIEKTYQGEEVSMVLDKTPSVISYTDGGHPQGYTYFRLRGMDQTRINMTLNGVPLNEPEDQGVYFSNYPGFTNNIQSAQIQRGVGTSTNGVSSYAGSINFESPTGLNKGGSVSLGYGSFNTKRLNASISTGLIDDTKLAFYGNFSTFGTDGYKYNSGGNGHSFFMSGVYYGSKDVLKVTAFSGRSYNQMAWNAVSEDDIANDPRTNYNTPDEDDDFMQNFVQVQYTRRLAERSIITTTAYYNRLDGNWDLDLEPLGAGPDILNYQLGSNFLGLMSNYKYVGNNLNLNIGAHGNLYERDHAMAILPDISTTFYNNTGYKNEVSGFIKAGYDIGKLTLFGDGQLRYVTFRYVGNLDVENQDWSFFNPKGGVVYNYDDNWRAYASVGQSHREPTRNDMFMGEDDPTSFTRVSPEEVIDYEAGFSYTNKKFFAKVNGYYMDFKNEITLIGALGSNGLPLMTNVDQSFRSGVEIELEYKPIKGLTITNNSNFSHNRIIDGNEEFQPLYTPPVVNNTRVAYEYKGLYIDVTGKAHSEAYIDFSNEYTTPSFFVLGSSIGYTHKRVSFMLTVNNITSTQYYTNGYVVGDTRYFFVNAPINTYATVKINL
jgi:iron complex outermembrane receptor protein